MKFQNRQKAFDKMSKDLELTQSELVKEQAKSVQLIHQNSVCLNRTLINLILNCDLRFFFRILSTSTLRP